MAVQQTQALPPQYVEDLQKDLGAQLTGLTAVDLDTDLFAPKVAGQDQAQLDAYKICLLYTSPSPRDRTRSRMPSSA